MNKSLALGAVFLSLFAFLLYGKSFMDGAVNSKNYQYVPPDYVIMADQIIGEVESRLTKRYKMKTISSTSGMAGSFNVVGLGFQIKGPLARDEIRKILIDGVEEFLTTINANELLRPFLETYPFTEKGIIITLFISDNKGRTIYDPEISVLLRISDMLVMQLRQKIRNLDISKKSTKIMKQLLSLLRAQTK